MFLVQYHIYRFINFTILFHVFQIQKHFIKDVIHTNTRQLYYLVTISDFGSLSQASKVLGISQPALSKFLTETENSLGFLLFLRYRRQLTPTAVGRYVIDYAQKVLDAQTRMLQTLRAVTDQNHTQIRLATAPNRGAIIYSRIYNQFSRRYPNISLTLRELYASEQPGAIQHGQIDMAIGSGQISDKVTDIPFASEELLVSLPSAHPLAQEERICLADLKDTPFVLQGPRHSIRILADRLFHEAGFHPVIAFESNDVILIDSMLHEAVGAGLVSKAHVHPCDELVYRPLEPPVMQTLHIRYPLNHTLTEPERYLAGLLMNERLSDPRYNAVPNPEAEDIIHFVSESISSEVHFDNTQKISPDISAEFPGAQTTPLSHRTAPEISLDPQPMEYIIAIADEKSLTKAADKNYLSQPALSRHLRNIESMLCTPLFTRVHNRLQPNNAGKIFVNFARNTLQMQSEMMLHIETYRKGHGGGIYIQCNPSLAFLLKNTIVEVFRKKFSDVSVHMEESSREDTQEALLNASADFGFYFTSEKEHPILDNRILAENELVYCFHGNIPDYITPGRPLPMIPPNRPLILSAPGTDLRTDQNHILEKYCSAPPQIICEAQLDILRFLIDSKIADSIIPRSLLCPDALSRSCPLPQPYPYYMVLAQHPGRTLPSFSDSLMDLVQDSFRKVYPEFHII